MANRLIAAIDIGTTAVKAALFGRAGEVIARFSAPYATRRPAPGRVEQDPADWLALTRRALAALAAAVPPGASLTLGLAAQVNTHVFVDAAGRPLLPAWTWADTRAAAEAAELDGAIPQDARIRLLGAPVPIDASHVLPRMVWLARHDPRLWDRCACVLLPKDYVLLHLTGTRVTDPLSNIGLTTPAGALAVPLLAHLPGAAERLPALVPPATCIGTLRPGEPLAGASVACGTMDAWAALAGLCGAEDGAQVWLSGTSEVLGASARAVVPTPGVVVFPEAFGIRLHAAPTQAGGAAAEWCAGLLNRPLEELSALVAATPSGPDTPLFLPQLDGERAPLWNPRLRGAFLGLTARSGPGEIARAVFEGVALSARHAAGPVRASAGLAPGPLRCGGGGFRAPAWARIRADVMGQPLVLSGGADPGVQGAALIAAVAAGDHATLAEAHAATVRPVATIEPDPREAARYDALFAAYTEAIGTADLVTRRLDLL